MFIYIFHIPGRTGRLGQTTSGTSWETGQGLFGMGALSSRQTCQALSLRISRIFLRCLLVPYSKCMAASLHNLDVLSIPKYAFKSSTSVYELAWRRLDNKLFSFSNFIPLWYIELDSDRVYLASLVIPPLPTSRFPHVNHVTLPPSRSAS